MRAAGSGSKARFDETQQLLQLLLTLTGLALRRGETYGLPPSRTLPHGLVGQPDGNYSAAEESKGKRGGNRAGQGMRPISTSALEKDVAWAEQERIAAYPWMNSAIAAVLYVKTGKFSSFFVH